MKRVLTIFRKEVLDNFRDRRTLFSSLVFGPLFGPILLGAAITLLLTQAVSEADETLKLPVVGAGHAPNLIRFLEQNHVAVDSSVADAGQARIRVKAGDADVVLVIPEDYAEMFLQGVPARLELVADHFNNQAAKNISRPRRVLNAYSARLRVLRLQARGISPYVLQPVSLVDVDVSTPAGRSVVILGMMTYLVLFSMLMGGLYLAIDTTAGERERGSLEPLLTVPVTRGELILGKIAATCFYMMLSLAITLGSFIFILRFVPLEDLGMSANFGPWVALKAFLIMLPFLLLGASLMTAVASFTKSYKEAQTYLTVVLLIPTLPILFAGLYAVKPSVTLMMVPSLSQHLLMTDLIKNEPISLWFVLTSAISTFVLGLACTWLTTRLYRREGILG